MSSPIVTINLVAHNGEKYIYQCLDSVKKQTYQNLEVNILDNNSSDATKEIIKNEFPEFWLTESPKNLGMWPGQEELLKSSHGKYAVALSVDVILDKDFVKNAVEVMERDYGIGALQARVYKYDLAQLLTTNYSLPTTIIDTLGFQIFRSRRIINIGHGEIDRGQYGAEKEIFAVEGAVPVFRRQALEDCRLKSQIIRGSTSNSFKVSINENRGRIVDPDFFWYGDDLDLAWRMKLFGWKHIYDPRVIAYHDRQTTKGLAGNWHEFIKMRKTIPMFKRRLDWRNTILTIIKNDFASNLLRDSYYILWRQLRLWSYFLFFEPAMFLELFNVAKLLPNMLKRRKEIMKKVKVSAQEMRRWTS